MTLWLRAALCGIAILLACDATTQAADVLLRDDFNAGGMGIWTQVGRGNPRRGDGVLRTDGGFVTAGDPKWSDYELSFEARAPADAPDAQIWCGVRCADRDRRYMIGLRGGNNQHLYMARFCPYGEDRFFGRRRLPFRVKPGEWYRIRIQAVGHRIGVFLGKDAAPYLVADDVPTKDWAGPAFTTGGVLLGGGYLPAEYRDLSVRTLVPSTVIPPTPEDIEPADAKEQRRATMRAAYRPATVTAARDEAASLDGDWLFLPNYAFRSGVNYADPAVPDQEWHVMDVPHFWTPTLNWLFGEQARYNGPHMGDKGQSDNWWDDEEARCDRYTFDWRKTKSAWYRHHLTLPAGLGDRRYELCFDAIAKRADLWVNGRRVTTNIGMFRELRADVTKLVHPGDNLIALLVSSGERDGDAAKEQDKIAGIAVTVEVTNKMLNSLPAGMYRGRPCGVWQPVRLNITGPAFVRDAFFKPRVNGAAIDVEASNTSATALAGELTVTFVSMDDNATLHTASVGQINLMSGEVKTVTLDTGDCQPQLWSPDAPHLYRMTVSLKANGKVLNETTQTVGFRTFAVSGRRFLLNGKPYWLRGANHTPMPERPNDAALAERFLQLAHDNNVRVTRSHTSPFNTTWLDAADRIGVGVSYEGIWPWLMLEGGLPDASLLTDWKEEWTGLLRKYRNHPSILLWTVNNEMHVDRTRDHDVLVKKWQVLSDAIGAMRAIDPTRPVCADSGYTRQEWQEHLGTVLRPNHIDDGDIDDFHHYPGWYEPSFYADYSFSAGAHGKRYMNTGRPLITQEFSTGYPRTDDGLPTRFYTLDNLTPLALVGDYAYETADPSVFLSRLALTTQMLGEAARREHQPTDEMAGALHFSLVTWFHNAFDAKRIEPFAPMAALRRALQPVLVSAEMYGWNYYAGRSVPLQVSVLNDAEDTAALPATRLMWSVRSADKTLSTGTVDVPPVTYYGHAMVPVTVALPMSLPSQRLRAAIHLDLMAGSRVVSSNDYPILLADRAWAGAGQAVEGLRRYDPGHRLDSLCEAMQWDVPRFESLGDAMGDSAAPIVIADFTWAKDAAAREAFDRYVENGGRALLYQPGDALPVLTPKAVVSYRNKDVDIATMHVSESPIVAGIEPDEIAWFTRPDKGWPVATHGDFRLADPLASATVVVQDVPFHGYLKGDDRAGMVGSTVFPIRRGKGVIWVTQMAHEFGTHDPVAARLLHNLFKAVAR